MAVYKFIIAQTVKRDYNGGKQMISTKKNTPRRQGQKTKIVRSHKDRLFRLVFQDKQDILQLYNAVNGTDYRNADDLEISTMENAIYLGMKNDLSFLIEDTMNLYEHQSTNSYNLPVRGLFYFADIYRNYVESRGLNLYKTAMVMVPLPKYIVFYNGTKEEPDCTTIRLSDAFIQSCKKEEPCLECSVIMLNINLGHNKELMEKCKKLNEYAQFVAPIRANLQKGLRLKEAVDKGVKECIDNGILVDILKKNRAEVMEVVLTEYNEKQHLKDVREEGIEEGKVAGKAEDIIDFLNERGVVPDELKEVILQQTNLLLLRNWLKQAARVESIEEFEKWLKQQ